MDSQLNPEMTMIHSLPQWVVGSGATPSPALPVGLVRRPMHRVGLTGQCRLLAQLEPRVQRSSRADAESKASATSRGV